MGMNFRWSILDGETCGLPPGERLYAIALTPAAREYVMRRDDHVEIFPDLDDLEVMELAIPLAIPSDILKLEQDLANARQAQVA